MKSTFPILLVLTLLIPFGKTDAATLTVTSTEDSGPGTLRDALASASNGDTIDATGISGTISGGLTVSNSVTIVGPGPAELAVNGHGSSVVFSIRPGSVVSISGLAITTGFGGIFNNNATLTVSNCVFTNNSVSGIYNFGSGGTATLTVTHCTFTGNWTPPSGSGGAIFNSARSNTGAESIATAGIFNSTFSGNAANNAGGAICNSAFRGTVVLTMANCTVTSNQAGYYGGGLDNYAGLGSASFTATNCSVTGNRSGFNGGGIYNLSSAGNATFALVHCVINDNIAPQGSGGGIVNNGGIGSALLTIANSTLSGNSAGVLGGGAWNRGAASGTATLQMASCTLSGNQAVSGGGVLNSGESRGNGILLVADSTISSNLAMVGGGIYISDNNDNSVSALGPGKASAQILNSTLNGNLAQTIYYANCLSNSTLEIGSTILNAGASGSTIGFGCSFAADSITSLGYNLSSDAAGGVLANATDQINTDPLLGPLQDNGGPTFTCALLPGSPAIDQGKNFSSALYDQRGPGFTRTFDDPFVPNAPGGDGTDIGAFEVQASSANPAQVVQYLLDMVNSQAKRPRPLDATLKAALASIGRNNSAAAINQLTAFQNQVRAQVMRSDPALAAALLQAAQDAINGLNAAQH